MKAAIILEGMQGLGDACHQRAIVREYLKTHEVWLETPWPSMYHDMPEVHLLPKQTPLRTQAKNIAREASKYTRKPPPINTPRLKVWYMHEQLRRTGSFVASMAETCRVPVGDFSLPVPQDWIDAAAYAVDPVNKPIMLYRPLVERTEWISGRQRNPDPAAYAALFRSIRDAFFVVSIADLQPGKEWMVGERIDADVELHAGELDFETLAGLAALSSLVYTAPGFALILAQAVGTPVASVFGGHESSRFYDHGRQTDLLIDPVKPCECFSRYHPCDKRVDADQIPRLKSFVAGLNLAHPPACTYNQASIEGHP